MADALLPDRLALIRHLFAESTALLEQAHETAVDGQSGAQDRTTARSRAERLAALCGDVTALTAAVRAITPESERRDRGNGS